MHPSLGVDHTNSYKPQAMAASMDIFVTGTRKRDHFVDLLELRYRRLNSDNNYKTFFAGLSFLLANGSRIFPLPLYQILSFVLFSK